MNKPFWVIWKKKNDTVKKIKFDNYNDAKSFYEFLDVKHFQVKEISRDEYGVACGLYKLPLNENWLLAV